MCRKSKNHSPCDNRTVSVHYSLKMPVFAKTRKSTSRKSISRKHRKSSVISRISGIEQCVEPSVILEINSSDISEVSHTEEETKPLVSDDVKSVSVGPFAKDYSTQVQNSYSEIPRFYTSHINGLVIGFHGGYRFYSDGKTETGRKWLCLTKSCESYLITDEPSLFVLSSNICHNHELQPAHDDFMSLGDQLKIENFNLDTIETAESDEDADGSNCDKESLPKSIEVHPSNSRSHLTQTQLGERQTTVRRLPPFKQSGIVVGIHQGYRFYFAGKSENYNRWMCLTKSCDSYLFTDEFSRQILASFVGHNHAQEEMYAPGIPVQSGEDTGKEAATTTSVTRQDRTRRVSKNVKKLPNSSIVCSEASPSNASSIEPVQDIIVGPMKRSSGRQQQSDKKKPRTSRKTGMNISG